MFIERLLNQGNAPILQQAACFAATRHKLLAENIANVSTPGYRQKDMSVERFQEMLRERVAMRQGAPPGSVRFEDVQGELDLTSAGGIVFHDRNNRSMEQLMTDSASNALYHNMMMEL